MYTIEIIAHGRENFDVILFNERGIFIAEYSQDHLSALHAYVFVRGLVAIFKAGVRGSSATAYNYLDLIHRTEGNKN